MADNDNKNITGGESALKSLSEISSFLKEVTSSAQTIDAAISVEKLQLINDISERVERIFLAHPEYLSVEQDSIADFFIGVLKSFVGKMATEVSLLARDTLIIAAFISCSYKSIYDGDIMYKVIASGLGAYLTFKFSSKIDVSSIMRLLNFTNREDAVVPQANFSDIEDFSTVMTTLLTGYMALTTGVSIPMNLLKHLGNFNRVKDSLNMIFTMILKFFQTAYNYVAMKLLGSENSTIFLSTNSAEIDMLLDNITQLNDKYVTGEFYYNQETFDKINDFISEIKLIVRSLPSGKDSFNVKTLLLEELKSLVQLQKKFLGLNFNAPGFRQEPVGVLLKGGAGTGKSITMTNLSEAILCKILSATEMVQHRSDPMTFIHNRQFENSYWDGYNNKKKIAIFDDLGQTRDTAGNPDNEWSNLIRAINSFPYHLHMAELNQKADSRFVSKFVFCTTNMVTLNPESITCLAALERRFDLQFIVVPADTYTTTESLVKDYWNRKFDYERIGKGNIIKVNMVRYIPIDAQGNLSAPINFEELVELVWNSYEKKTSWYEQAVQGMESIRDKYYLPVQSQMASVYHDPEDIFESDLPELNMETHLDQPLPGIGQLRAFQQYRENTQIDRPEFIDLYFRDTLEEFEMETLREFYRVIHFCAEINHGYFTSGRYERTKQKLIEAYQYSDYMPSVPKMFALNGAWVGARSTSENEDEFVLPYQNYVHPNVRKPWVTLTRKLKGVITDACNIVRSCKNPETSRIFLFLDVVALLGKFAKIALFAYVVKTLYHIVKPFIVVQSKAVAQSFGHSDKMRHRSALKVRQEARAYPQMDTSGFDLTKSILKSNFYEFWVETNLNSDKFSKIGFVMFVKGRIFLCPYHFVTTLHSYVIENPDLARARVKLIRNNGLKNFTHVMNVRDVTRNVYTDKLQENDLCLVEAPTYVQPHSDRIKNFSLKSDWTNVVKSHPFRVWMPHSDLHDSVVGYVNSVPNLNIDTENYKIAQSFSYMGVFNEGDCGAVFTIINSKLQVRKIFGFHVAGNPGAQIGYSGAACQEDILNDLAFFEERKLLIVDDEFHEGLLPTKVVPQGQFESLGSLKNPPSVPIITSIARSRLNAAWGPCATAPARLGPYVLEGEIINPIELGLNEYCLNTKIPDGDILDDAAAMYLEELETYSFHQVERRLFTYEEAAEGIIDDPDFGPQDRSTSAGWPHNTPGYPLDLPKKAHFWGNGEDFDFTRPQSEVMRQQIQRDLYNAAMGIRTTEPFTGFPKDERRPFGKMTRFISGSTTKFGTKIRMYFGSYMLWFFKNKIHNGSAIGVNPYSRDWDTMATHLLGQRESDCLVGAGDIKGLDKNEIPFVFSRILDIINDWYDDGEENRIIREVLFLEIMFSRQIFGGEVLQWPSSMPSGNPLTSILNTMYVHLCFRYCWIRATDNYEFNKHVYLLVLGDDNVFSVSPQFGKIFNELTLTPLMAELGLVYTNDKKVASVYEFRDITEIEFLKRGFRYCDVAGRYVAPHRLEAILEVPYWTRKGSLRENITLSNFDFTIRELTLHGREIYEHHAQILMRCFRERMPPGFSYTKRQWRSLYFEVLSVIEWFY